MKITLVRVQKLVTGSGYNNNTVGVEALVEDGEDPIAVHDSLVGWIDARLANLKVVENLKSQLKNLHWECQNLERKRDSLKEVIERGNKTITEHEKLADLAKANSIQYSGELGDLVPF